MKTKIIVSTTLALLLVTSGGVAAVKNKSGTTVTGTGSSSSPDKVLQAQGQADAPQGSPTWEIQQIEKKMEQYNTSPGLSAEQKASNAKIKQDILNSTFDLRELSRLALDQHWDKLGGAEQNHFVSLMTDLLETKAIFSKEQSKTQNKAYTVYYKGDKYLNNKTQAQTLTQIFVPKENVTLDIEYRLKNSSGNWKIFDVKVDDASLIENYRYQFNNIITKQGYPELVKRMNQKLSELKSKKS